MFLLFSNSKKDAVTNVSLRHRHQNGHLRNPHQRNLRRMSRHVRYLRP